MNSVLGWLYILVFLVIVGGVIYCATAVVVGAIILGVIALMAILYSFPPTREMAKAWTVPVVQATGFVAIFSGAFYGMSWFVKIAFLDLQGPNPTLNPFVIGLAWVVTVLALYVWCRPMRERQTRDDARRKALNKYFDDLDSARADKPATAPAPLPRVWS